MRPESESGSADSGPRWIAWIESALLSLLLGTLVVLGGTQILLRNVFDSGVLWIDPLLRMLVLWLGLIGAAAAARQNKNIRIDLINRYLPPLWDRVISSLTHAFTAAVCGLIGWHGARMVIVEKEFAETDFLDIPIWILQSVIPFAFGLIALVYLVSTVTVWYERDGRA